MERHPPDGSVPRGARSIARILEAAARLFGREGYQAATMQGVARAAGVSKGLLHYHFASKEHLLIETLLLTFRRIHRSIEERFAAGDVGIPGALRALDAIWEAMRDMAAWTPFMVETMSLAHQDGPVREHLEQFYAESEALLLRGTVDAFQADVVRMRVPPERLSRIVRTILHGLIVELSYAQTADDLQRVEATYKDMRKFFEESILTGD